ncbi:phosphoglycerate dehydrogenase [Bacteroidia bacterium]|nr:phosphoglycerate dehydrogenase [Bacteroidia bacterium]
MSTDHRILIIDEVHPVLLELLAGFEVIYMPNIALNELEEAISSASILVVRSKLTLTKKWIDRGVKLKYIGRLGSGMDNIDVAYAASKNIMCENAPEGNRNAVAEQTVGMMLSLLANISRSSLQVKGSRWDRKDNQGIELRNLTVGIIGFGNVGSRLAEVLHSFGCKIMAYDKFISGFGSEEVEECSLEELQKRADVISLHVPLNEYSLEMVNESFINKVDKPFFMLNLSRGSVVNISDIVSGLESKKIRGLALDVLPNENLGTLNAKESQEFDYLVNNENVIVTPHIGGLTKDSYKMLAEVLAEKIKKWDENNPLVN